MEDMKWDMGGAGAVAGTMLALALRKAKANVVGICGLVENMPDGNAQRPGDVVTSMSGQTIEVINTDAEGRLVLCDALTFVQREFKPKLVVDLATLTGAIIASLAHEYAGIFSNDDTLTAQLTAAGVATGDKLWRMPMGPVYDRMIDSPIADMKNIGGKFGGSITAAQFLLRYIEKGTPGRISTLRAWSGPTRRATPGTRARPAMACACSTVSCATPPKGNALRVDFYLVGQGDALVALPPLAAAAMKAGQRMLVVAGMAGSASAFPRRCGAGARPASLPMARRAASMMPASPS
jgi:hypothetical protein